MARNTDVTPTSDGTVGTPRPADVFRAYMLQRAQDNRASSGDRSQEVMDSQLDRIFMAAENGTSDEVMDADAGGNLQGRDLAGLWIRVHDFDSILSNRTFDDDDENGGNTNGWYANGWYAQMHVTCIGGDRDVMFRNGLKIGAEFVLQTGAELVAGKVRAYEARGELPHDFMIIGITTASNNTVLKLGRVPEHVTVQATAE